MGFLRNRLILPDYSQRQGQTQHKGRAASLWLPCTSILCRWLSAPTGEAATIAISADMLCIGQPGR